MNPPDMPLRTVWNSAVCICDKTPTVGTIIFQLIILIGFFLSYFLLHKHHKRYFTKFFIVAIGVSIFEIFTAPMWNNDHLGVWAYIYQDVSWVLNIGWTTLIFSTVTIVDDVYKKVRAWKRFLIYLAILAPTSIAFESIVISLGIRSYAPEVLDRIIGWRLLHVPVEAFYYIPVFMALVISFYKYWQLYIDRTPTVPVIKTRWIRNLILSFFGVFLFELMIEPMVVNAGFPAWSYIYHDISIILSGIWVFTIWIATGVVDRLFIHFSLVRRFLLYLILVTIITLPLEMFFISNGFRVYGPSAVANFSGFVTPITQVPIEVAFAIPMYLALVIAFIRYIEIILDNKNL